MPPTVPHSTTRSQTAARDAPASARADDPDAGRLAASFQLSSLRPPLAPVISDELIDEIATPRRGPSDGRLSTGNVRGCRDGGRRTARARGNRRDQESPVAAVRDDPSTARSSRRHASSDASRRQAAACGAPGFVHTISGCPLRRHRSRVSTLHVSVFPKNPRSRVSKRSGRPAGKPTASTGSISAAARRGLRHRHAAADRQRIAARRPRVFVHPHRPRRALPADARQGGVLSDGLGRQRPADRTPRPELLRRAVRPVAAVRRRVRRRPRSRASSRCRCRARTSSSCAPV